MTQDIRLAIIGLGYVGLPLAVEFGKKFTVFGFDINQERINQLNESFDITQEVSKQELSDAKLITYTTTADDLVSCDVFIVTVPTPLYESKQPDLSPLKAASELVGSVLRRGGLVVYESTVYPGATEEFCVPILEQKSGLKFNKDFYVGYSPERINPGDKEHRLTTIKKITSGSTEKIAESVDSLYRAIISAGTHKASSIKVAEAAKIIENTQRDLNIGLINELALIFNKMEIDTEEVLAAAKTKWNFLPFSPGLVGGHCIGVDPYYLTYKAELLGFHPEIILAGRRINDGMGAYVAQQLIKKMIERKTHVKDSNVLILGLTFKENCPDTRNTRVVDVISELQGYGANVDVFDPWVDKGAVALNIIQEPEKSFYDAIIVTVAHKYFVEMGVDAIREFGKESALLFDVKSVFSADQVDIRL
ncbi:MAG: Vi polysaccharide biosynthesis UDP-N-acetylglucosamine C-6 dehydrogenase TviB [Kordiimonadaceae bacterium]|nr:Vi polysaccharide biosynthesis UDP-N-acetylglucosamine C-6 dehydrogenase TviB [Kordiimonadaceae bacterium]